MIFGIICIALGLFIIYGGIRVVKTRLTYWVRPTFGRYKDRNTEKSSKLFATIIGTGNILTGVALIYIGIRVLLA
jgi:hypothetical protein